jgi:hypothetical protein
MKKYEFLKNISKAWFLIEKDEKKGLKKTFFWVIYEIFKRKQFER